MAPLPLFGGPARDPDEPLTHWEIMAIYSHMKRARIAELKDNLSRYLDHVRGGGTVLVLDRNLPVARIVPIQHPSRDGGDDDARLARLERRGLIRRGTGGLPDWLGRRRPPRLQGSVLRDLFEERESGW